MLKSRFVNVVGDKAGANLNRDVSELILITQVNINKIWSCLLDCSSRKQYVHFFNDHITDTLMSIPTVDYQMPGDEEILHQI